MQLAVAGVDRGPVRVPELPRRRPPCARAAPSPPRPSGAACRSCRSPPSPPPSPLRGPLRTSRADKKTCLCRLRPRHSARSARAPRRWRDAEKSPSRSGAFANTSSSGSDGPGSSSRQTFTSSSGCEVGGTSARSSSETFETASRIADSCSRNRSTSSSVRSRCASCATCRTCSLRDRHRENPSR